MGKIIAVVSGKGGTGKTTFVANTGLALAAQGHRVLCVDCDMPLRNLDLALGLSDRALMDVSDVAQGRCDLADAVVQHHRYPLLDLLAAPAGTGWQAPSPEQMGALYEKIRQTYEFCLVDAPAGLGAGFRLAADHADSAVVVTTTDQTALRDAQRTVMELRRFPPGSLHLVVGRVQRKMLHALHTTIDDAIDTAGLPLLGVVPEDSDLAYALNKGVTLRQINSYSARAYENIARRLTGQRVPLMKI